MTGADAPVEADGEALRHLIERHRDDAEPVIIDFTGVVIASVSFFDESFGMLSLKHSLTALTHRVKVENISPADRALLNNIVLARQRERDEAAKARRPVLRR